MSESSSDKNEAIQHRHKSWWGIEVGCLARVSGIGGKEWKGELVIVLEEVFCPVPGFGPKYKVLGKKGTIVLPYYALFLKEKVDENDGNK